MGIQLKTQPNKSSEFHSLWKDNDILDSSTNLFDAFSAKGA